MPQLSTLYIFSIFVWTWLVLYLITQKIETILINKMPATKMSTKPLKKAPILPWT